MMILSIAVIFSFCALYFAFPRVALPWMNFWGATPEERFLDFPGSEKIKNQRIVSTHAITIRASPETIWKYLVQIGQNKAGFYSYRWLENLVGCHMPDIKKIVPEFQKIELGDKVFLHPKAPPLTVTALIPQRVLGLEGWYLALNQKSADETRLLARGYDWRDPNRNAGKIDEIFSGPLFDIAHFIMERKMLLTIKQLSETDSQSQVV